jgi:hypothetical protein
MNPVLKIFALGLVMAANSCLGAGPRDDLWRRASRSRLAALESARGKASLGKFQAQRHRSQERAAAQETLFSQYDL